MITVEDNTADVKISLWRNIANSNIHLGEFAEEFEAAFSQHNCKKNKNNPWWIFFFISIRPFLGKSFLFY